MAGFSAEVTTTTIEADQSVFAGDFNADGYDDLFVFGPGEVADEVRFANPDGSWTTVGAERGGEQPPVVGDFDGDHADDVLWATPGKRVHTVWYGHVDGEFRMKVRWGAGPATDAAVVADTAADGTAGVDDIVWIEPSAATHTLWGGAPARGLIDSSLAFDGSMIPLAGAFSGDHVEDLWAYRQDAGGTHVMRLDAGAPVPVVEVTATGQVLGGDFNGDRVDDVYVSGEGSDFLATNDGSGGFSVVEVPGAGSEVVAGDFDRDNTDDIYAPGEVEATIRYGDRQVDRVMVVGDSLMWGLGPFMQSILAANGMEMKYTGAPATGLLDFQAAWKDAISAELPVFDPDVVILEASIGYGEAPYVMPDGTVVVEDSPEMFVLWEQVMSEIIDIVASTRADVYLVINPLPVPGTRFEQHTDRVVGVNEGYERILQAKPWVGRLDWHPFAEVDGVAVMVHPQYGAVRSGDGFHFSDLGYTIIAEQTFAAVFG
ncbi:MAG: hypothetical protein JJLCMIEE_00801 [Acidimicrobiales bacterium]|nr:MAG: hypothetical protein EDR02_03020 [Actinomycetota bacterium]MBV6507745.1 hypothetical protein [Acidimicrobiales bacterium]RIK07669.1 MAG: hypothetical protein DCC48_04035 [Acidobacteriota bacterium]